MLIAIITDTHFGGRNDSSVFLSHQERFFSELFFPYLDEHNIRTVLHLGDTFDRRKYINFLTLHRCKEFYFDELEKRNIDYHTIAGNHDCHFKDTNSVNSIDLLCQEYSKFQSYSKEPVTLTFGSTDILMVPWITKENKERTFELIEKSSAPILAGHLEILGFEMSKGILCDHGFDRKLFDKFDRVWSGHFHHASKYGNIEYLGTPWEMTWIDYNGVKGFHVFDTETRTLTRIHNPKRLFNKLHYNDSDLTIEEIKELDASTLKDTFVKLIVQTKTNPYLFELFTSHIQQFEPYDLKIIEDKYNLELVSEEEIVDEVLDTRETFFNYIETLDIPDKNKLKKAVSNLYQEALALT